MNLPFFRWKRRPRATAEDRLGRLRKVLNRLDIDYPDHDPEIGLRSLPPSQPPYRHAANALQPLWFPVSFTGRIAVLEGGFHPERNVREFAGTDIEGVRAYAPEALVAPLDAALTLADQKIRGLLDLPSLRIAIVVLTSVQDSPLADHHRDLLWRAFGVPVFEHMRAWDGIVLARECEAHDGIHIDLATVFADVHDDELLVTQLHSVDRPILRARTGLTAEIVRTHCECGSESPRLRNLTVVQQKSAAAAAC
ncbi:MAG TPA: hypothetical protein VHB50_20495 [Bryobacteraceae bacterium]|nr:hypothetical protein [Bryobacteraceae bacterium]